MSNRITKSKRFWVTTIVSFAMIPACYYSIHLKMDLVATLIATGVFASAGVYVNQETKRPSDNAKASSSVAKDQ